jgi:hypothetical protein
MSAYRIALANLRFPATPEDSMEAARRAVAQASLAGADLLCFPECFVPGYRAAGKRLPPPGAAFLDRAWSTVANSRSSSPSVAIGDLLLSHRDVTGVLSSPAVLSYTRNSKDEGELSATKQKAGYYPHPQRHCETWPCFGMILDTVPPPPVPFPSQAPLRTQIPARNSLRQKILPITPLAALICAGFRVSP